MIRTALGILTLSCFIGISAHGAPLNVVHESIETNKLAKGLVYEHKSLLSQEGWIDIYTVLMDLDEETLDLDVIRNQEVFGRSGQLKAMSSQNTVMTAAVNASFFSMGASVGEVIGLEAKNKKISYAIDDFNYYSNKGASLYVTEQGQTLMDFLSISMTVVTEKGDSLRIQGINTRSVNGEPIIYNRAAYKTTESINQLGELYKVVVVDDVIQTIIKDNTVVEIPENGYVMVFQKKDAPTYMSGLKEGQTLMFKQVSNFKTEDIQMMIAGGGFILKDGLLVSEGLIIGEKARHPRTAVGIDVDTNQLVLMVVDGRGASLGATHEELGYYLQSYGVDQAIHFDGGGSSEMVTLEAGDREMMIKNTPSDGHERNIVNGLGILNNAPTSEDFELKLEADQTRVFVNNTIGLKLKAVDDNYHPVAVDNSQVAWTMSGGYGDIRGNQFTPRTPGEVTLTAQYKGKTQSLNIEVVDTLIDLEIYPKVIQFEDGVQTFTVIGTDDKGYKSVINNNLLTWTLSGDVGSIKDGVFTNTGGIGQSRIDVKYGDVKEVAYVVSGEKRETIITMKDAVVTSSVYPETVLGESKLENDQLTIQYNFEPSEVSQAVYATFKSKLITRPVDGLALNMGDFPQNVSLKAQLIDVNNEVYTITFENYGQGLVKAVLPSTMAYPVKFERLYVVTLATEMAKVGTVRVESIDSVAKIDEKDLDDVIRIAPKDQLYEAFPSEGFEIGIFGATAGRNRLLDEVVMNKVYDVLNESDYAIYAGKTSVDSRKITNNFMVYQNAFKVQDLGPARVINLAMGEGSLVKTDSTQWSLLGQTLKSTVQDTIVIVGTEQLINNDDQSFTKEGELIHQMISDYQRKSGKTVFYVNASGYAYNLSYYEGIRYIDLNGLWYRVDGEHAVDLYDSFQLVQLNFDNQGVTYRVEDLYPKTTVTSGN